MTKTSHCNFILLFAAIACVTIVVVQADTANENGTVLFSSLAVTFKKTPSSAKDISISFTHHSAIENNTHPLSSCGFSINDPVFYPPAFGNAQDLSFSINTHFIYRSKYRNDNIVFVYHRYSG